MEMGNTMEVFGIKFENTFIQDGELEQAYAQKVGVAVIRHNEALRFVKLLESCYTASFLIVIGINMIIISITGLQTILNTHSNWDEIVTPLIFTLGQFIHLLFLSLPSQQLENDSAMVREASYVSNWYKIPWRSQKFLTMILMKSMEPCHMTAGKFFVLNMETFSTVLQTSMSYLMVLASFQ